MRKVSCSKLLIVILAFAGCVTIDYDSVYHFRISAIIVDSVTGEPIENMAMVFVDTGIAKTHPKDFEKEIAKSDSMGQINGELSYFWGGRSHFLVPASRGKFSLVLTHERYKEKTMVFRVSELSEEGRYYVLELGSLALEPLEP